MTVTTHPHHGTSHHGIAGIAALAAALTATAAIGYVGVQALDDRGSAPPAARSTGTAGTDSDAEAQGLDSFLAQLWGDISASGTS
jgi:hypothetical protein